MATLNFKNPAISFSDAGLKGEKSHNPTAIDFARSGEPVLFVAQQDGSVWRYVVEKQASGGFAVSKAGTPSQKGAAAIEIDVIKKTVTNYTDDGKLGTQGVRQVTGLTTAQETIGGVKRDVLYVTSSDHQIGGGSKGTFLNIDTNSSQLHKIVLDQKTGAVIDSYALIRGLPRSPENHSSNGVDLATDPATGDTILYLAQGANTNKGAPSNNMVGMIDPALAGAILKINLTELSRYDVRVDGAGDRFVIDLPTLNDPKRKDVDLSKLAIKNLHLDPHFALDDNGKGKNGQLYPDWAGGADGFNQAKITAHVLASEGGKLALVANPMTVVQPGHRNPYDVLVTREGEVITWDNGPNGGWGGEPLSFQNGKVVGDWTTNLATNWFNESASQGFQDQLHVVGRVGDAHGPYAGFPNALRAAKEVLDRTFGAKGQYLGKTASSPIKDDDGTVLFRDEGEARDYLASLLPVYRKVGGSWVDVRAMGADGRPILPVDLHTVVSGYDWAHPGSSIADPKKHFTGKPLGAGTVFSPESQQLPWGKDGSLILGAGSTNGLAQYTASSWFGGALDGAIIATGFGGGKMLFTQLLDTNGDGRTDKAVALGDISGFGALPLSVTALGDKGLGVFIDQNGDGIDDFSGVIFAVTYGANDITSFVPGGKPAKPSNDLDGDGLSDVKDTHVGDPLDGRGVVVGKTPLVWDFVLSDPAATPPAAVSPWGPAGGIGLTAAWSNGRDAGVDGGLYDDDNFDLGGASSFVSSARADTGTAEGAANSLRNVLGIGATLSKSLGSAKITTEMVNIFDYQLNRDNKVRWDGGEEVGLVLGPDQSDFVRAAIVMRADGTAGLRLYAEAADVQTGASFRLMPGVESPAAVPNQNSVVQMGFVLDLTPGAEAVTARARYQNPDLDGKIGPDAKWSQWFETDPLALPGAVLRSLYGEHAHEGRAVGTVIGLYSRAKPGDDSFAASWDWVRVDGTPRTGGSEEVVFRWNAGKNGETVKALDGGPDWVATAAAIATGSKGKISQFNLKGRDASLPDHVPQAIFDKERWDAPAGKELTLSFGAGLLGAPLADGLYAVRVFLGNGYAKTSQPGQRAFDVSVEGEALAKGFDPIAAWGDKTGGMLEWRGRVSDGAVDIAFQRAVENPFVNGVEIVRLDAPAAAKGPVVSVLGASLPEAAGQTNITVQTDRPVPLDKTVQVSWEVRPVPGGATPGVDYKVPGHTLSPSGAYVGKGAIAGGASDLTIPLTIIQDKAVEGPEAFEVVLTSVSGGGATIGAGTARITILDDDSLVGGDGASAILHRVNAGGAAVAAADGGPDWAADQAAAQAYGTAGKGAAAPQTVLGAGRDDKAFGAAFKGQNATGTPDAVFATHRFSEQPGAQGVSYAFDVQNGQYVVSLLFAEVWTQAKSIGARIFDVRIEGQPMLGAFDVVERFGWNTAGSVSLPVTVTDGTLNLDVLKGVQNPMLSGIEIRAASAPGGDGGGSGGGAAPKLPADAGPGFAGGDFSDKAGTPTMIGLGAGSNLISATQSAAPRDVDFATFTVPPGHALGKIALKGFEAHGPSGKAFLGLAQGGAFPIDPADLAAGSKTLLGGAMYGKGDVGSDLLAMMADGVIQGAGNAPTKGFSGALGPGTYTLGWSQDQGATTSMVDVQMKATASGPVGSAEMVITPKGGIQVSNYGRNAFQITNTGDKPIVSMTLDVRQALYPDIVFDPFGIAGDTVAKKLTIDTNGGTGVKAPNNGSYLGKGGIDGYHGIKIAFDPGVNGGFTKGESLGFSVDMDANSIAGSTKATLDAGTKPFWDVGGVSGAEMIGSKVTLGFADGSTAVGQLHGMGNPSGGHALITQAPKPAPVAIKVNGLSEGGVGLYGEAAPKVTIQGEAGQTARVILTKGFIQPVENKFTGPYKAQLDAQLAKLAASEFPANNAVEFQTVDVTLTGKVQDITAKFDVKQVKGVTLASEDDLPLGFVAAVINDRGLPVSAVSKPIYLGHDPSYAFKGGSGDAGGSIPAPAPTPVPPAPAPTEPDDSATEHRLVVWAGGEAMTTASGGLVKPRFELLVDGRKIATETVKSAKPEAFDRTWDKFVFKFEGGPPTDVAIAFVNDRGRAPYGPGDDVNLYIDRIKINQTVFQAEEDGYVTTNNLTLAQRLDLDGPRESMMANGVMLFDDLIFT